MLEVIKYLQSTPIPNLLPSGLGQCVALRRICTQPKSGKVVTGARRITFGNSTSPRFLSVYFRSDLEDSLNTASKKQPGQVDRVAFLTPYSDDYILILGLSLKYLP